MNKIVNMFFFVIILIFFLSIYKYYSSNKNINSKEFNRKNIDTNNVIIFNDGYTEEIKNDKIRSFWNLLKDR